MQRLSLFNFSTSLAALETDANTSCALQKKLPPSSSTMGKLLRPAILLLTILVIFYALHRDRARMPERIAQCT